jgi:hypothetical protein
MRPLLSLSCVSLLLVAACTDPKNDDVGDDGSDATDSEGDGDGDPGDGDGEPGDGDGESGDGDGDGDPTGDGDGDGDDDPMCMGGDVSDSFQVDGLAEATTTQTCTVSEVNVAEPQYDLALACTNGNANFDVTIDFAPSTALGVAFPFAVDDEVTLESWYDDFPPFYTSYTIHDGATGDLRLAWISGFDLEPLGAAGDWSNPIQLSDGPGCTPDSDNTSKRSIVATAMNATPITIYSSHAGVLTSDAGDYELRVTLASYNPDIEGGCNSCYTYALVGE